MSLFESQAPRPLADKLRPTTLAEVVGQEHLLNPHGAIGRMVAAHRLASMVLWGPPGCGKTTIARLLAEATSLHFEAISGPWERLFDDEADLIIHHVDKSDTRIDFIDLFAGKAPKGGRFSRPLIGNRILCGRRTTSC